jgi:hypothetical protein
MKTSENRRTAILADSIFSDVAINKLAAVSRFKSTVFLDKKLPNEPISNFAATLSINNLEPNRIKHLHKTNPFCRAEGSAKADCGQPGNLWFRATREVPTYSNPCQGGTPWTTIGLGEGG